MLIELVKKIDNKEIDIGDMKKIGNFKKEVRKLNKTENEIVKFLKIWEKFEKFYQIRTK